jgi:tetratricopeptide (TPR) repeat protein
MPVRNHLFRCRCATQLLIVIALLIVSLPAQTPPATHDSRKIQSPYSKEQSSDRSPGLAQKEEQLRASIAQQPRSAELSYSLALLLREEGKAHESLDIYTQAAQLRGPTAEEIRSVALDYVLLNDYEDAIHWLERAARVEPGNVNVLYSLGRCYFSKDRYLDAERMFAHVLAIDPKHLKAEENLGLVFDATNQPDKAEEALRMAATWANKEGPDEWPFVDLGMFLLDRDRAQESIDPLRTAVHIRPDCAACHEKLGRALLTTHALPEGIAELEKSAQLEPANPKTHYELGRALRQAGQADRAQQEFAISQKLYAAHSQE